MEADVAKEHIKIEFDVEDLCEGWWSDLQRKVGNALGNFTSPINLTFHHEPLSEDISDEKLESASREAKAMAEITEVLKHVEGGKRLRVLRAASILSTGKDLGEL